MEDFVAAALGFPTALFTFLLVVVVGYWLVVLLGGLDVDVLDADAGAGEGAGGGFAGFLGALGLGGVPVTVVLSLLIAFAWFGSLAGASLLAGAASGALRTALLAGVLVVALAVAWLAARLAVAVLRRALPGGPEPSRADFVGRLCVVRTGRVTDEFGQAEVVAADGSTAIIQVRVPQPAPAGDTGAAVPEAAGPPAAPDVTALPAGDALRAGDTALIFDFDRDGEFFWVVPADAALRPDPRTEGQ